MVEGIALVSLVSANSPEKARAPPFSRVIHHKFFSSVVRYVIRRVHTKRISQIISPLRIPHRQRTTAEAPSCSQQELNELDVVIIVDDDTQHAVVQPSFPRSGKGVLVGDKVSLPEHG